MNVTLTTYLSVYWQFYKEAIEVEKSELYQWQGDANNFEAKTSPYIEVVTSPNNPDGRSRKQVVKGEGGVAVHDLAYYWPHYTPITSPADYDVMLFTLSKATGHAGSRVGLVSTTISYFLWSRFLVSVSFLYPCPYLFYCDLASYLCTSVSC